MKIDFWLIWTPLALLAAALVFALVARGAELLYGRGQDPLAMGCARLCTEACTGTPTFSRPIDLADITCIRRSLAGAPVTCALR